MAERVSPGRARFRGAPTSAAWSLWSKSAGQGLVDAQYNLGVMYASGLGLDESDESAAQWYQKAAEQGLALAQFNLGVSYATGKGVKRSYATALEWYRKAAKQGHGEAKRVLSKLLR
jgi:TPR repeat protein